MLCAAGCASAPHTVDRAGELTAAEAMRVQQARLPLALPGVTLLHEVAIGAPDRFTVCVGRLTFPTADSLHLMAQTPFGVTLFQVRCEGPRCSAQMTAALHGRVPALGLAREIGRIYLGACPAESPVFRAGQDTQARCTASDGARLYERIDPAHRLVERAIHEAGGRALRIRYRDWAPLGRAWHPRRITLVSGDYRIEIALRETQGP